MDNKLPCWLGFATHTLNTLQFSLHPPVSRREGLTGTGTAFQCRGHKLAEIFNIDKLQ
jgi:hypothetical protein